MSRSAELAALYGSWQPQSLGSNALETARMGICDAVACMVAGAGSPAAAKVRALAVAQGVAPEASLPGTPLKLAAPLAALCNGVAGHVLDYDDMSFTLIGHPSVVLAPALLALGEARGASGREVLAAYVLGFEVDMCFARWMVPAHYDAGWHATSSIGIFGAAAATASLLRLDPEAALAALAIAASQAAGLRANFGSMTKSLHAGQAAEAGLRSALLAAAGFTANAAVFDAAGGFFDLYGTNLQPAPAPEALEIVAGGIGLKVFACCGAGATVVEAACEAHAAAAGATIREVELVVSARAASIMPYAQAQDALRAKYCLAYCAAVALLDGAGGMAQFSDERVRRDDVQALMKRVRVRVDPGMQAGGGRFDTQLTVRLDDRAAVRTTRELPLGHPRRPIDARRMEAKFMECTARVVGDARAREAFEAFGSLESLPTLEAAMAPLRTPH